MEKELMLGNEAIARGAWEAGIEVAAAYPGTPSTEILEAFARYPGVYAEWATNEKVALDVAIGAAYAGRRAMAAMKHVGLNVAADSFFYASMTGAEAALIVITADDPAMHSSQNEQDNRRYAKFARVPCLEPSDSQEAKEMMKAAVEISEQFDTPVLFRITTRIAHSAGPVTLGERATRSEKPSQFPRNVPKYVMLPAYARLRHPVIEERIKRLEEFAEIFQYNRMEMGDTSLGIVTCGVAYQYAREVFPEASFLRLGMTYPIPKNMVREFASRVKRLIVIEELDPFLEEEIRILGIPVEGKSIFPICGEFDPTVIREAAIRAGLLPPEARVEIPKVEVGELPPRPPVLCPGCPHRGVFYVMAKLKLAVTGDIGCYTLGALPPLSTIYTCGCMGAGIGQAHGADKAGIEERMVAVIGDSTFFHTGMPALLNVAYNGGKTITVVMDNLSTAMTGHQGHPGTGETLQGQKSARVLIEDVARAFGIKNVYVVDSYDIKGVEKAFREALAKDEPAVIVARRECALLPEVRKTYKPLRVDPEKCNGCGLCFRIGCPATLRSEEVDTKTKRPKMKIDPLLCTGCEVCAQVCPRGAIFFRAQLD